MGTGGLQQGKALLIGFAKGGKLFWFTEAQRTMLFAASHSGIMGPYAGLVLFPYCASGLDGV